jgi:hypothetical protein
VYYKKHGKSFSDNETFERAIHAVNHKLWIYRNGARSRGMTRGQALDYLEQSIVEKRRPRPAYLFDLESVPSYKPDYDKELILSAIADKLSKDSNGRTAAGRYLYIARYARKNGVRPKEVMEVLERYRYQKEDIVSNMKDTTTAVSKWERRKIENIDLVEQLERYLLKYRGKRIIIYGGPIMVSTLDYGQVYALIDTAYGRPNNAVLVKLYRDYCGREDIVYKEDIIKEYIRRVHAE